MKKIFLLTFILSLVAVAGIFANGQTESQQLSDTWSTITVTGPVSFNNWPHPEITSRGKTYELMVPPFAEESLDIKAGDQITVEGIVIESSDSTTTYLKVIKATIDGKDYYVPYGGMGGPGYGGMAGRGYGGMGCYGLDDDNYGPNGGAFPRGRSGRR